MPAPYALLTPDLRREILDLLGPDAEVTDTESLDNACTDASGLRHGPELVVRVRQANEISRLLAFANERNFPVVPRGAGTGLAGGCLASSGGVVLCLDAMDRILALDDRSLVARVQPGVLTRTLRDAARDKGLFYPPDPASLETSTLGGNAATNAGGPACVKYGTTRDYVLGLEAVLPSGEVIRTGVATRKGVVGYDLTHLLVGSEGTLGVITEMTLKLMPLPPATVSCAVAFETLPRAMCAVTNILTGGLLPSALEFLDQRCLSLVGDLLPFEVTPGATLLLVETDGHPDLATREMDAARRICRSSGATHILPAHDDAERERLWWVRRQVSLRIHDASAIYMPEDVAVPIGRIDELVARLPEFEKRHGLTIYAFGHAGDGNIHLNITTRDPEALDAVTACVREVLALVVEMEGTMSGEHGVGLAKKPYLPLELAPSVIGLQRSLKDLLDPNHILNPGKIFPDP